jgi:hypothetical protein
MPSALFPVLLLMICGSIICTHAMTLSDERNEQPSVSPIFVMDQNTGVAAAQEDLACDQN